MMSRYSSARLRTTCAACLLALAVLACGCDRLLGLSHLDDAGAGAGDGGGDDGDSGPTHVAGTLHVHCAPNDSLGQPVETDAFYGSGEIMLSVVLDDGSHPAVDYNATTGAFGFDIHPGKPYRFVASTPYGVTDYELDATSLDLVDRVGGRRTPTSFTVPTIIQGRFTAVPGYIFVTSTGVWTQSPTEAFSTGAFDYDIGTAYAGNPRVGPLEAAQHDRVYLTKATFAPAPNSSGYLALDGATEFLVTLPDGGLTTLGAQPSPINRDKCVHLTAGRKDANDRLIAANPAYKPAATDWGLYAVPSIPLAPVAALWLALESVAPPTPYTNIDYDVAFANPYPGSSVVAEISATARRDVSIPGSIALAVYNTTQTMVAVGGSMTSCAPVPVSSKVGIYGAPQVAGVTLDADNKPVTVPAGTQVPVVLSLAVTGPVDWTDVDLVELVADNGATRAIGLRHIVTNRSAAFLDAGWLQPGHTYVLAQTAWLGFPGASSGDLDTSAPEMAYATTWSSTFVAQ